MSERIDHKATAEATVSYAMNFRGHKGQRWMAKAQVNATLALVEQQRIANLIALAQTPQGDREEYSGQEMGALTSAGMYGLIRIVADEFPMLRLDIAAALGIGGPSE